MWLKIYPFNNHAPGRFSIQKGKESPLKGVVALVLNSFKISIKEWVAKTNALGLRASAGRYGGTYAHKDIAFEFGMWISAEFKIYLILTDSEILPRREVRYSGICRDMVGS